MAQLERDIIAERVKAGLRRARENGKKLGRPRIDVSTGHIAKLRSQGLSIRDIAGNSRVSRTTVWRIIRQMNSKE